jgi:ssDNA-specific exonuclease RecJ
VYTEEFSKELFEELERIRIEDGTMTVIGKIFHNV